MNELVSEVSEKISAMTKKIDSEAKWNDGNWLSKAAVSLASLNATLGEHIAGYEQDENTLEAHLKYTRESIIKEVVEGKRGDKKTEAYAKATARIDTQDIESDYIKARYVVRLLNIKRVDTNNLVTAIQSRLRYLNNEAAKSNLAT